MSISKHTALCLVLFMGIVIAACSSSRTKHHAGVDIKLLSVSRMAEYQAGMQRTFAKGPDQEVAVVQVEFSSAGGTSLKLPANECELKDTSGNSYRSDMDMDFSLGGGERVMVWDFTFAVPKTASLNSLRLGSAEFDLGGVRELEPNARMTPGSHPRRQ